jgi:hypothetical protein
VSDPAMKAKLFLTEFNYDSDQYILRNEITDWEEITQEDVDFISKYKTYINQKYSPYYVTLVIEPNLTIKETISDLKIELKQKIKEDAIREAERKRKEEEKLKKLKERRLLKDKEKVSEIEKIVKEKYGIKD